MHKILTHNDSRKLVVPALIELFEQDFSPVTWALYTDTHMGTVICSTAFWSFPYKMWLKFEWSKWISWWYLMALKNAQTNDSNQIVVSHIKRNICLSNFNIPIYISRTAKITKILVRWITLKYASFRWNFSVSAFMFESDVKVGILDILYYIRVFVIVNSVQLNVLSVCFIFNCYICIYIYRE